MVIHEVLDTLVHALQNIDVELDTVLERELVVFNDEVNTFEFVIDLGG